MEQNNITKCSRYCNLLVETDENIFIVNEEQRFTYRKKVAKEPYTIYDKKLQEHHKGTLWHSDQIDNLHKKDKLF